MLLHPFLEKVGAGKVLSALDSGPARSYDSTAVALSGMFAFALGSSSLEGSKHLLLADAGLLVGIERFPHLRTLRPRLAALADAVDPLALQVTFAKAMLAPDADPPSVFRRSFFMPAAIWRSLLTCCRRRFLRHFERRQQTSQPTLKWFGQILYVISEIAISRTDGLTYGHSGTS